MIDFDPVHLQKEMFAFGLMGVIVITVLINLFVINKYLEIRRANRLLVKHQSLMDPRKLVKEYFEEQFYATKRRSQPGQPGASLSKEVVALRTAYLKIERKALEQCTHEEQFWKLLNEHLMRLMKVLMPSASSRQNDVAQMEEKVNLMKQRISKLELKSGDENALRFRDKALQSLDGFANRYRGANQEQQRIAGYVDKMAGVVNLFDAPERRRAYVVQKRNRSYLEKSEGHLDNLQHSARANADEIDQLQKHIQASENVDVLERELANFKRENLELNNYVAELKTELLQFGVRLGEAEQHLSLSDIGQGGAASSLVEISEQMLEANEQEIDRLRSVINNQRSSISNMEDSLRSLESLYTDPDSPDRKANVENLKRNIKESETCIRMLESELETLKDDVQQLRNAAAEPHITETESQLLAEELKSVKKELDQVLDRSQQQLQLLDFVNEALSASSVEDVSLLIFGSVSALQCEPNLMIRTLDRTIELTSTGGLSTREKMLVNSMLPNEVNPNARGELLLNLTHIAGVIKTLDGAPAASMDQQQIVQLLKTADRVVHNLIQVQRSRQTNKILSSCVNQVKHASYDLDKLLEGQTARNKVLVSQSIGQIQDLARARGVSASHIAAYQTVEQEALRQLSADASVRLKLRKRFLQLLNEIEAQSPP